MNLQFGLPKSFTVFASPLFVFAAFLPLGCPRSGECAEFAEVYCYEDDPDFNCGDVEGIDDSRENCAMALHEGVCNYGENRVADQAALQLCFQQIEGRTCDRFDAVNGSPAYTPLSCDRAFEPF